MTFKILLIKPYSTTGNIFQRVSGVVPPLNLAYLAGFLQKKCNETALSIEVSILDLELDPISLPVLKEKLISCQPDLIGFTVHTNSLPTVILLSKIVKKIVPDVRVVLGGPHPTVEPESTLQAAPQVDFIVCNEGEQTFFELIVKLINNDASFDDIPGLCYRDARNEAITCTETREFIEDLESIGSPAVEFLDYEKYLKIPQSPGIWKRTANVFTERGCPYNCSFCASPVINRRRVRFFPIDAVIEEIKFLKQKYRIEHVTFRDSNLTLDRRRSISLCMAMMRARLGITWNFETRVNLVDPRLLKIMKAAGCIKISFGVESGSPRILKKINKGITVQDIKNAFRWCKEVGMQTQAYFMAGFPTEDAKDVQATMALIKEIKPDFLFVSTVVPLPGTQIFTEFKQRGLFIDPGRYEAFQFFYRVPSWKTMHFDMKELVKLQRRIYMSYVLSPGYILKMIKQINGISQLKYYFGAILGFFDFLFKRR